MDWTLSSRFSQTKLRSDKAVTIGREGCDICIKSGVELKHAAVFYSEGRYFLRDLAGQSGDGVFINGEKLDSDVVALNLNDRLRFGYSHVTYTIDSASVSGPHAAAVQLDNLRAPNLDHALRNSDLTSSITSTHEYSPSPTSPVSVHVHAASTYPGVSGGVDMRGLHGQDIISHMDPDAPYDPNGTSVSALTNGRSETGQISSPPPTVSHRQAPVTSTCTVANVVPTNSGQHGTDRIRHGPSTEAGTGLYGVPDWWGQGSDSVTEISSVQPKTKAGSTQHSSSSVTGSSFASPATLRQRSSSSASLSPRQASTRRSATPDAPRNSLSPSPMRRTSSLRLSKEKRPSPVSLNVTAETPKKPSSDSQQRSSTPRRQASPAPSTRENTTVALRKAANAQKAAARQAEADAAAAKEKRARASRRGQLSSPRGSAESLQKTPSRPSPARSSSVDKAANDHGKKSEPVGNWVGRSQSVKSPPTRPSLRMAASPGQSPNKLRTSAEKRSSTRQPLRATAPLASSSSSSLSSPSSSPAVKRDGRSTTKDNKERTPRGRSPWNSIKSQARRNLQAAEGTSQESAQGDILFMSVTPASGAPLSSDHSASVPPMSDSVLQPQSPRWHSSISPEGAVHYDGSDGSLASLSGPKQLTGQPGKDLPSDLSAVSSNTSLESANSDSSGGSSEAVCEQVQSTTPHPSQDLAIAGHDKPLFLTEVSDVSVPVCSLCNAALVSCTCNGSASASSSGGDAHTQPQSRQSNDLSRRRSCPIEGSGKEEDSEFLEPPKDAAALVAVSGRKQWNKMERMDGLIVSSLLVLSERLQQATVEACQQAREVHSWCKAQDTPQDENGVVPLLAQMDLNPSVSPNGAESTLYPPWGAEHQDMATVMRNLRLAESQVKAISEILQSLPPAKDQPSCS